MKMLVGLQFSLSVCLSACLPVCLSACLSASDDVGCIAPVGTDLSGFAREIGGGPRSRCLERLATTSLPPAAAEDAAGH